jgi:DNA polymerase
VTILYIDCETRSTVNLKTAGLYKYAEQAEIVLLQWAEDSWPVKVENVLRYGFSPAFAKAWKIAVRIIAHNKEFDATMLDKYLPGAAQDPRWYCTAAQARRHSLPGGLDKLCDIFKLSVDQAKSKAGYQAMMLFCKPLKEGGWATEATHPAMWQTYVEYARLDVGAMRALHSRMPTWNDDLEMPIWRLDQRVNARGFAVDVDFAEKAVKVLADTKSDLNADTYEQTDGMVGAATQGEKLLNFILAEHGVDLPNLQKDTLERRMDDESLPQAVRDLLALRLQSAKTSTGKYKALLDTVSSDGRLRGTKAYCGAARTGRWAGKVFQPDNLPRKTLEQGDIDAAITATKLECLDLVATAPTNALLSNAIRGVVCAPAGRKLCVADYASIEGRIIAWLAGEEWKLQAYRLYDQGEGDDLYKVAYAKAFGTTAEEVTKEQRQIGKVMELMLGFGGGVGAFITGAATYRIDLNEMAPLAWAGVPADVKAECARMWLWAVDKNMTYGLQQNVFMACDALKRLWRRAHPRIETLWSELESSVHGALNIGGVELLHLQTDRQGTWLRIKLPSGRYLSYPGARVENGKISYLGQNPYTRQWGRIGTYGGKLAENVTQAVARDILCNGMLNADDNGFDIVMHVHDEIVAEAGEGEVDYLIKDMVRAPTWAKGLPLAAAGFECERYRKE